MSAKKIPTDSLPLNTYGLEETFAAIQAAESVIKDLKSEHESLSIQFNSGKPENPNDAPKIFKDLLTISSGIADAKLWCSRVRLHHELLGSVKE